MDKNKYRLIKNMESSITGVSPKWFHGETEKKRNNC